MYSKTLYQYKCECLCNVVYTFAVVVYLICQPQQHAEEPSQVTLSGRKLTSARVIRPIERRGAVYDQQSIPGTQQEGGMFIHNLIILLKPTAKCQGKSLKMLLSENFHFHINCSRILISPHVMGWKICIVIQF